MIVRNTGKKGLVFKLLAGLEVAFVVLEIAGAGGVWRAQSASASTLSIPLASTSHVEKINAIYQCTGPKDLRDKLAKPAVSVTYLNSGEIRLAVLQVEGQTQVFSNVISADGARYTANRFEWWNTGDTALFSEVGGDNAPQLTCKETHKAAPRKTR
ncbi:MliC family protein [Acetobacter orleanensis]|uniref:Membrane-bound lysozyme inhibitor of C-type lysozyme n=1 Tax=Acetobacter orleanensis TaxID=104099 RepID=A0A4Y3TRR0_9PROT|nr:MliC family protein [Acetobacter orleanensis]GAN69180.1 hypothetical protein Abol_027_032 [Acetobacter orleanensis JCM 7639]GEB83767.1 membrane-bound lysozyme inhibitor of C-type lysozyme [Acetobacter orleanensis]